MDLFTKIQKPLISGFSLPVYEKAFRKAYEETFAYLPRPQTIYDINTSFGEVRVYLFVKEGLKTKPPLVLLHGHYASSIMWQPNLYAFMEEGPVYAVDLLGEPGKSIQRKPILKEAHRALWLLGVLQKLQLEKVIFIGSSLGGYTAANFARFYPDKVLALILLDPVFVFSYVSLATVGEFFRMGFDKDKMIPFLLHRQDFPLKNTLGKTITLGLAHYRFRIPMPRQLSQRALKKLTMPVLAILAGKSRLQDPYKAASYGRRHLENLEMEVWAEASHAMSYENNEEVEQRVHLFLQNHNQSTS